MNDPGDLGTAVITFVPIIIVMIYRVIAFYIEKPKDFKNRLDLVDKTITERLSMKLTHLLNRVREIRDTDQLLRGDGDEDQDLVNEYSVELRQFIQISAQLRHLRVRSRISNSVLFGSSIFGILVLLMNMLSLIPRAYVVYAALVIIAIQISSIVDLFSQGNKLENYERFE